MEICNIKDRPEFIEEIAILTQNEWSKKCDTKKEYDEKIQKKIKKIKASLCKNDYCCLTLLDKKELMGFISIFPQDSDEREDLTPWYSTMYVKKEYRGKGYSKILNEAILKEAKARGFSKLYLKTVLDNYYEKFGAKFMGYLSTGEKLFYFEIK